MQEANEAFLEATRATEAEVLKVMNEKVKPLDYWNLYGNVLSNKPKHPMVLLLGNHSAGKSTFLNSLLGEEVQATGVAPIDDGFTVIMRGERSLDEDGPTLVGTPSHGFSELQSYGPYFVNHLKLKIRKTKDDSKCPPNLMLIDSPGMIGSPRTGDRGSRGYDLLGVTKWFAERADVILLLFDPANPGTTGETLDVLTQSLQDMEHKFLIVMNKVDQFDNVSDFARAYGALCWNLSKVVNRKDIPRIYTMFTPQSDTKLQAALENALPIDEFAKARHEVTEEVLRAPSRRMDNHLTLLSETAWKVYITAKINEALRKKYASARFRIRSTVSLLSVSAVAAACSTGSVPTVVAGTCLAALFAGASEMSTRKWLANYQALLLGTMDATAKQVLPKADEQHVKAKYEALKPLLMERLAKVELSSVPRVSRRNLSSLEQVIEEDVPRLRESAHKIRYSAA
eukprot:TRINITY_DN19776_c0_g1_i1.p1 TRINITY_DN19776_c0_g1~~TRINITY_DN19776_c0_g1_i1.p1  ORF type:complete len:501 (+),score=170.38 TRINITY_DN19776_c0_g1_i1:137-1504(+)